MVFAAEFGTGQVLWSIIWFTLFVMWVSLVIRTFGDIIRTPDLSGWGKAMWVVGIVFMPFLGVFLYLIVNGDRMGQPGQNAPQTNRLASGASTADELSKLATLHESGALTDEEYDRAKTRAVAG